MIKAGDLVYCHRSLIFETGEESFTKGEIYEVKWISNSGEVKIIDNQGDSHIMGNIKGIILDSNNEDYNYTDNLSYESWFSHRKSKLDYLLVI